MGLTRWLAALSIVSAAAAFLIASAPAVAQPVQRGTEYVLALSWSPNYCRGPHGHRSPMQCDRDADLRFIVHGLWPNVSGRPVNDCPDRFGGPRRGTVDALSRRRCCAAPFKRQTLAFPTTASACAAGTTASSRFAFACRTGWSSSLARGACAAAAQTSSTCAPRFRARTAQCESHRAVEDALAMRSGASSLRSG